MPITSQAYFAPTSISGCALWLDGADQSSTGMTLSGTSVTSWNDKSGNGRNLTASSAYPTITSNGLLFNGATPNVLSNAVSFAAVNGINSFVVFSSTVAATRQRVFVYLYSGQKIGIATDTTYNSTFSSTIGGDGGVSYSTNTTYIYGGNTYAGSPFISHSENVIETQYSPTYSVSASGQTVIIVGGQSTVYFTGTIKEVILYDAFLTISQRQQVEGYLAQKWSLQSILPQGHIGITFPFYRAVRGAFTTQTYSTVFSPKSISGCALWYDGNDPAGTGVQPSNGATVATWSDKSGNANHGTSGTATFQTDSLGGYINFTGSQSYTITNPNIVVSQYFTIFVVEQLQNFSSANNGAYTFVAGTGGSTNQNLHLRYGGTGTGGDVDGSAARFGFFYNDLNCSTNISPFTTNAAQPTRIWTASFIANSRILYLFSVSTGSDANNSQISSWTGAVVGAMTAYGGQYYNGKMRELMIYSGTLGTTQRQTIESYLAAKWGLISNLPASHLHFTQPAGLPAANSSLIRGVTGRAYVSGGISSTNGIYTVLTFAYPGGTLVTNKTITATYLVIGGGGGGGNSGYAGGGGGGGLVFVSSPQVIPPGTYTVTVGVGGPLGTNGGNSVFNGTTGTGGGYGSAVAAAGGNGGCGGGGEGTTGTAGGTGSQGFNGSAGYTQNVGGGGGGGMGQAGSTSRSNAGNGATFVNGYAGGNGITNSITGSSVYYAGGGGGGGGISVSGGGPGGLGGGGNGNGWYAATAGTNGLGGGGGAGAIGGNGIVIISYVFT